MVTENFSNSLNIQSKSSLMQSLGKNELDQVFLFPELSREMIEKN